MMHVILYFVITFCWARSFVTMYLLASITQGGSVAECLACWTQAQKGPGSNRSRDAVA